MCTFSGIHTINYVIFDSKPKTSIPLPVRCSFEQVIWTIFGLVMKSLKLHIRCQFGEIHASGFYLVHRLSVYDHT